MENEYTAQQLEWNWETIKPAKTKTVKDKYYRDFSNRKSFDNTPCGPGEVLVPLVLSSEMCRTMEPIGLDSNNVETWHFPYPVPIAFVPVKEEKKEAAMVSFHDQVRWYLEEYIFDGLPMGDSDFVAEEVDLLQDTVVEEFTRFAESKQKVYGILIRGLMEGYARKELVCALGITGCKAWRYRKLGNMVQEIQQLYLNYFS